MNTSLYEVELDQQQIKAKEPIDFGVFFLQHPKLRDLELNRIFLTSFCDVNEFEDLEMYTDFTDLALAEKEQEGLYPVRSESRKKTIPFKASPQWFQS